MKYFLKLNVVSILYALMAVIPIELMFNVLRISRLTGSDFDTVAKYFGLTIIVVFILGTIIIYSLTKNWLRSRKANFWTLLLWFPYFILLIYLVASFFPVTYGGDDPGPGAGLIALGGLMVFPIYILIINLVSYLSDDEKVTSA